MKQMARFPSSNNPHLHHVKCLGTTQPVKALSFLTRACERKTRCVAAFRSFLPVSEGTRSYYLTPYGDDSAARLRPVPRNSQMCAVLPTRDCQNFLKVYGQEEVLFSQRPLQLDNILPLYCGQTIWIRPIAPALYDTSLGNRISFHRCCSQESSPPTTTSNCPSSTFAINSGNPLTLRLRCYPAAESQPHNKAISRHITTVPYIASLSARDSSGTRNGKQRDSLIDIQPYHFI